LASIPSAFYSSIRLPRSIASVSSLGLPLIPSITSSLGGKYSACISVTYCL
ncbi:unnamed protein product, partial [Musa acuminata subsp. burmannicoides]